MFCLFFREEAGECDDVGVDLLGTGGGKGFPIGAVGSHAGLRPKEWDYLSTRKETGSYRMIEEVTSLGEVEVGESAKQKEVFTWPRRNGNDK